MYSGLQVKGIAAEFRYYSPSGEYLHRVPTYHSTISSPSQFTSTFTYLHHSITAIYNFIIIELINN